jgi:hypothetical protein
MIAVYSDLLSSIEKCLNYSIHAVIQAAVSFCSGFGIHPYYVAYRIVLGIGVS